ncbi:MAG: class B sortase [Erysipelotrichaceae bacterium]|nr:class B sortase [Erysipelotrichaceae bacterium]
MKMLKKIIYVLIAVLLSISVYALYNLYKDKTQEKEEIRQNEELSNTVHVYHNNEITGEISLPDLNKLKEINNDLTGWLYIENAGVDYPVMYTPNDVEKYLHLSFDESYSFGGLPFIGENCDEDSYVFIIYGHNMLNGTMFGSIDQYSNKSFYEDNQIIEYTTLSETRKYQIVYVFNTVIDETSPIAPYFMFVGNLTEESFDYLIDFCDSNKLYNTGQSIEYGDQVMMLSTCYTNNEFGRFVIVAKRVS